MSYTIKSAVLNFVNILQYISLYCTQVEVEGGGVRHLM